MGSKRVKRSSYKQILISKITVKGPAKSERRPSRAPGPELGTQQQCQLPAVSGETTVSKPQVSGPSRARSLSAEGRVLPEQQPLVSAKARRAGGAPTLSSARSLNTPAALRPQSWSGTSTSPYPTPRAGKQDSKGTFKERRSEPLCRGVCKAPRARAKCASGGRRRGPLPPSICRLPAWAAVPARSGHSSPFSSSQLLQQTAVLLKVRSSAGPQSLRLEISGANQCC